MRLLYSSGVTIYTSLVHVVSLWNPKARKWVKGRRESWKKLETFANEKRDRNPLYWFHCASLGEFEQARPLIETLKSQETCLIAVSFFSPSGYEIRKNYPHADVVFYLPTDSVKHARRLFDLLKPTTVFFIKYEFWAHYISEAYSRQIPIFSVAAVFRKNQIFFKSYGSFMRSVLKKFNLIFVQNQNSFELLSTLGIKSVVAGDTRYDRVMQNSSQAQRFALIDQFTDSKKIFICGSLWQPDLQTVCSGLKKLDDSWKIILTTHETDEAHLSQAESYFSGESFIRYSKLNEQNAQSKFLLIDNVGMLMHLYGYGHMAYVGGAFKTGLHNILEPASFGIPVIFGPQHSKFPEADLFIREGVGFSITNSADFERTIQQLLNTDNKQKILEFMRSQCGATERILSQVNPG